MTSDIKDYINNKYAIGALLISGKWGAGKTWTMKKIKKEYSLSPWWKFWRWRKFRFVSLFGIKDVEQFNDVLKSKYSPTWYSFHKIIGFIGIAALIGIFPNLGTLIGKWSNVSWENSPYYELFGLKGSVIASFVAFVLFISFYFFINRKIKKRKFIKKNVFIFDDMERCDLPMITLLGLINELVEDSIKVIIIANEDKISEDRANEYKQFKEKVVLLTLTYNANAGIHKVFDEINKKYKTKYGEFLATNKEAIIVSFTGYAEENIRALINALSMFEKIFQILTNKSLEHKERVLMSFLKVYYLVCQGYAITHIYDNLPYGGLLAKHKKSEEQIPSEEDKESMVETMIEAICSDSFFIRSLAIWIEKGYFDKKAFEMELDKIAEKQKPKEQKTISDFEKLLRGWSLEEIPDEELHGAYEEALKIAYKGETNFDGYINLMSADKRLELLEIKHKSIDWIKFENGLLKYIDNIEVNNNFEDSNILHHRFITTEDLNKYYNDDAKRVYQKIENYNPSARKNRKEFIKSLKSKDVSFIISTSYRKIFDVFDEEMCDAFLEAYENTRLPTEKRDLLNVWREISGSIKYAKTSPEIRNAITKLKDGISNIKTVDNSISQKINKTFIADLMKFIQSSVNSYESRN